MYDVEFTESRTLRQGDIVQRNSSGETETRIVITTNCDIRHNKHRELITTVLLMKSIDYVSSFVLSEEIFKLSDQLSERIVNEKNARNPSDLPIQQISDERFLEWIIEAAPTLELQKLFVEWPEIFTYRQLLLAARSQDQLSINECMALIQSFRQIGIGKSAKNLVSLVDSSIKSPPKDFVFLAGGASLNDPFGYVAHLRNISIVEESQIQVENLGMMQDRSQAIWKRIAKVKDYYLHNILQKFGLVFGSIGMPTDFEMHQATSRELISELMLGEIRE